MGLVVNTGEAPYLQGQSLVKVDFIDRPKSNKTAQEVTITEIQQFGFDF